VCVLAFSFIWDFFALRSEISDKITHLTLAYINVACVAVCAGSGGDYIEERKSTSRERFHVQIGMMSRYKSTHDIYDQKTFVALETSYFGHLWAKVILTLYV
jgi:hypothetical protein